MNIDHLHKLTQQTLQKMDAGDFESALNLAYRVRSLGEDYIVSYTVSGLLIDIGVGLANKKIVEEGIKILERDFETIVQHDKYAPTAYYNLANGYYAVFQLKMKSDPYVACFKETELDQARVYYRKALEYDLRDPMLIS